MTGRAPPKETCDVDGLLRCSCRLSLITCRVHRMAVLATLWSFLTGALSWPFFLMHFKECFKGGARGAASPRPCPFSAGGLEVNQAILSHLLSHFSVRETTDSNPASPRRTLMEPCWEFLGTPYHHHEAGHPGEG